MKVSYVNANTWTREGALDKTGLKAYWRFNETSGNIINQAEAIGSTDSADNTTGAGGSDLTTSGVTYNVSKSPMNYSLQFDGSNDYARGGNCNIIGGCNGYDHYTISTWVKFDSFPTGTTVEGIANFRYCLLYTSDAADE